MSQSKVQSRQDFLIHHILVPLLAHLALLLLLSLAAYILKRRFALSFRFTLAVVTLLVIAVAVFTWKWIVTRSLRLRIFKEVSASRCGDHFLQLANHCFRRKSLAPRALTELAAVSEIRKHPNLRFLQTIRNLVGDSTHLSASAHQQTLFYLSMAIVAKNLSRQRVVQNLGHFLARLDSHTYLVLYGYSSTICRALVMVSENLKCPIFVIEDLQYGVADSLAEHDLAMCQLRKGSLDPIALPFGQIAPLCSTTADFVVSSAGVSIPLRKKRHLIALIGCEALDARGRILIPSEVKGRPSETAKFAELFQEAKARAPANRSVGYKVVVVAETYKVYENLPEDSALTHAPIKSSWSREVLYVLGLRTQIKHIQVQLYEFLPSGVDAVIDDAGIHTPNGDVLDLSRSVAWWDQLTKHSVPSIGSERTAGEELKNSSTVIFDLNGVLVNDEPGHYTAFENLVRELGASLTYQEYLTECSGLSDAEGIQNLMRTTKLRGSPDELLRLKRKKYRALTAANPLSPFPRAIELVGRLARDGKQCFLVTSASQADVEAFIVNSSLKSTFPPRHRYFEVRAADRAGTYKRILTDAGVDASRVILIDDTPSNLLTARELGIGTIGLTTKHSAADFRGMIVAGGVSELLEAYPTTVEP